MNRTYQKENYWVNVVMYWKLSWPHQQLDWHIVVPPRHTTRHIDQTNYMLNISLVLFISEIDCCRCKTTTIMDVIMNLTYRNWISRILDVANGTMRKSAWESSNIRNDFEVILGPIFTLFRCCGIDFHELSCNHRLIYRFLMVGWTVLTLGTCGYRLLIQFPSSMMSISLLHWTIEFLNYWIYLLSIFIALRCMARWARKVTVWLTDIFLSLCPDGPS